jgi:hypothetical protein
MRELFRAQLHNNSPITPSILYSTDKRKYFNGEKIEVGDKLLFALMVNNESDLNESEVVVNVTMVVINERHFDLLEPRGGVQSCKHLPLIKLKQ